MAAKLSLLIKDTKQSAEMLIKSMQALPQDKLHWSPGGKARTPFAILQECAGFPAWIAFAINNAKMPNEEDMKASQAQLASFAESSESTLTCFNDATIALCKMMETFPESRLNEEMTFPWGTYTLEGTFGFHYWNNTYHLGQINYLQLILGDDKMHM